MDPCNKWHGNTYGTHTLFSFPVRFGRYLTRRYTTGSRVVVCKLLQHATNLQIIMYLHNRFHLIYIYCWVEIKHTTEVSAVAATPICEIIHNSLKSLRPSHE